MNSSTRSESHSANVHVAATNQREPMIELVQLPDELNKAAHRPPRAKPNDWF